jgi:hypothetical protein
MTNAEKCVLLTEWMLEALERKQKALDGFSVTDPRKEPGKCEAYLEEWKDQERVADACNDLLFLLEGQ